MVTLTILVLYFPGQNIFNKPTQLINDKLRGKGIARNSVKNSKKKALCHFWLFKYILWPWWFAYELPLLQDYAHKHVFLLSIY